MLMAIFLVYSTSGITSGEKLCRERKMTAIVNVELLHTPQTSDKKRSFQIMPPKFFCGDDVIDDVTG